VARIREYRRQRLRIPCHSPTRVGGSNTVKDILGRFGPRRLPGQQRPVGRSAVVPRPPTGLHDYELRMAVNYFTVVARFSRACRTAESGRIGHVVKCPSSRRMQAISHEVQRLHPEQGRDSTRSPMCVGQPRRYSDTISRPPASTLPFASRTPDDRAVTTAEPDAPITLSTRRRWWVRSGGETRANPTPLPAR